MNEEEKKAYRQKRERVRQEKKADFQRRENYQKQLKEETLKTFKDKPDEIRSLRCVHVEGKLLVVEWDAPSDNNSPILRYNVYLSSKRIRINEIGDHPSSTDREKHDLRKVAVIPVEKDQLFYEFLSLDLATCYYVVVTAENKHGEGYKAEPLMVRTLSQDLDAGAGNLYVWGNNANSELGLSDEQVTLNLTAY